MNKTVILVNPLVNGLEVGEMDKDFSTFDKGEIVMTLNDWFRASIKLLWDLPNPVVEV